MDEWEISFNLQAGGRAEHFQFLVNPMKDKTKEFPNFPKDKFLRALQSHGEENKYTLHSGMLTDLKFKRTSELNENQEIHILMLVMGKIGPISLIFRQSFEHLVLEGIDSQYNYLGSDVLLSVLVQIIKPDSPSVKGLGKITTVYHASNIVELTKRETFVSFLDSVEGQIIVFSLSIILPTIMIIILPTQILDTMIGYVLSLAVLAILWCLYPAVKRSTRYAPLSVISVFVTYLLIEIFIHIQFLEGGINPWGIFNNISRQNLVGILKRQEVISELGREVFLGIELLQVIVPFLDSIIIILIPFSIGVGLSGLFMISERKWKSATALRVLFAALFLIAIITIPLTYHALGKGSEGTLHASIGLLEMTDMFSSKYITNLNSTFQELEALIASAQEHLAKAGNSFRQFGENPLIAYILPYLVPDVAGIPLEDLPEILTLTTVLANTVPYFSNILWGYYNLQLGMNQSFDILLNSIESSYQEGLGSSFFQEYDAEMREALKLMQHGVNNLTTIEDPILALLSEVQETFNYSVFDEMASLLSELEIGLPILITVVSGIVPWINSTYKLSLVFDSLNKFDFKSRILIEAEKDYNASLAMRNVDVESLPKRSVIPFRDLTIFSLNLHQITKYLLYSLKNTNYMFQSLNNTLIEIQAIDFSNSSNVLDPRWNNIDIGLNDTSEYLKQAKIGLENMSSVIDSQEYIEFEELDELNFLLDDLEDFTHSASSRINFADQYVSALNGTLQSIKYFSLGSYSFNETLTATIQGGLFEPDNAINNFTLSQISANSTYENLTNVKGELLNESAVENWQELVRGDITNNNTNSIYMNAQQNLYLIADIENDRITPIDALINFEIILDRMEQLDNDWNIFTV
ncbi:MAG: hypothetical protein ACFFB2_03430 [Promethearchaeota archaeon]